MRSGYSSDSDLYDFVLEIKYGDSEFLLNNPNLLVNDRLLNKALSQKFTIDKSNGVDVKSILQDLYISYGKTI